MIQCCGCMMIHFCYLQPYRSPEPMDREAALHQQIERLKRERASICLPKPNPGAESKPSPETNHQAGSRGGHMTKDNVKPPDVKKEKASLFYELISVRVGAECRNQWMKREYLLENA